MKRARKKNRKVKDMIESVAGERQADRFFFFGKMRAKKLVRRRRDKRVEEEEEKKWESFRCSGVCGCTHGAEQPQCSAALRNDTTGTGEHGDERKHVKHTFFNPLNHTLPFPVLPSHPPISFSLSL